MKSSLSAKLLAGAALAVAGFGAATAAHARSDVYFSIGLQGAPVYYEPAPVYVEPQPVYVQPRRVYVAPPPVYVQPAPIYYRSYEEERGWRRAEWQRKQWRHHHRDWD